MAQGKASHSLKMQTLVTCVKDSEDVCQEHGPEGEMEALGGHVPWVLQRRGMVGGEPARRDKC